MAHAHCMLSTQVYKCTHSGCVLLIAFPLQQWLQEHATILCYMYICGLVCSAVCLCSTQTVAQAKRMSTFMTEI